MLGKNFRRHFASGFQWHGPILQLEIRRRVSNNNNVNNNTDDDRPDCLRLSSSLDWSVWYTRFLWEDKKRTSVSGQNGKFVDTSFLVVESGWDANLARRRVDLELAVLSESVAHCVVDDGVDSAIRICGRDLFKDRKRRKNEIRHWFESRRFVLSLFCYTVPPHVTSTTRISRKGKTTHIKGILRSYYNSIDNTLENSTVAASQQETYRNTADRTRPQLRFTWLTPIGIFGINKTAGQETRTARTTRKNDRSEESC